jgi:hypothetical protein
MDIELANTKFSFFLLKYRILIVKTAIQKNGFSQGIINF